MKIRMNFVSEVVRGGAHRETAEAPHTRICFRPTPCLPEEKIIQKIVTCQKCCLFVCNVHKVFRCPNCS
jgi:hypothetical protein